MSHNMELDAEATVAFAMQYQSGCRDCADAHGVCPVTSMPCDPALRREVVRHTVNAINYGLANGYLTATPSPQTSPATEGGVKEAIEDYQFLARMQVGIRDCIGLDRDKLTIAKRLRAKGFVTIADSANGPMIELTEEGAIKALERFVPPSAKAGEGEVRVKALEWEAAHGLSYKASGVAGVACTVRASGDGMWQAEVAGTVVAKVMSHEAAKSAAQEHYTNAVLGAIETRTP